MNLNVGQTSRVRDSLQRAWLSIHLPRVGSKKIHHPGIESTPIRVFEYNSIKCSIVTSNCINCGVIHCTLYTLLRIRNLNHLKAWQLHSQANCRCPAEEEVRGEIELSGDNPRRAASQSTLQQHWRLPLHPCDHVTRKDRVGGGLVEAIHSTIRVDRPYL